MSDILLYTLTLGFLSGTVAASNFVLGFVAGVISLIGINYFYKNELAELNKKIFIILIIETEIVSTISDYMGLVRMFLVFCYNTYCIR